MTFLAFFKQKKIFFYIVYFFLFKYSIGNNLINDLFNFIILNEENLFIKLKKIFLWIILHNFAFKNRNIIIERIIWKKNDYFLWKKLKHRKIIY